MTHCINNSDQANGAIRLKRSDKKNGLRMLQWMCGVTRNDKIRNEHIRGTTRVAQDSKRSRRQQLNWYGHVMRRKEEHILRKVLRMDIPGKERQDDRKQ